MIKVLFVDEKHYRFKFYYEDSFWWQTKNIKAIFKAYESKKDKWRIYLNLLLNRPDYVVFVQLSIKNILLVKLCNILRIKTLFWQHGVFGYDKSIINKYKKIKAKLNTLLCFSDYDAKHIASYFSSVNMIKIIPHYEIEHISKGKIDADSFLFIGQILCKTQIEESYARIIYDKESEILLNEIWKYLDEHNHKVYYKQHPGDKSDYIKNLTEKYENITTTKDVILPKAVIGNYSTLILPYIALGVPFIQVNHCKNKLVDFTNYSKNEILKVNEVHDIEAVFNRVKNSNFEFNQNHKFSISEELLRIIKE